MLDQSSLFNPNTFVDKSGKESLNKYLDAVKSYKQTEGIILDHDSKHTNIKEIATAFIMDIEKYKKLTDKGYRYLPLSEKELELSSFLQEIDPSILQVFFPE